MKIKGNLKELILKVGVLTIVLIALSYLEYQTYHDTKNYIQVLYQDIAESNDASVEASFLEQSQLQ